MNFDKYLDVKKLKVIFALMGKTDKKTILKLLYNHKQEIGFTDNSLLELASTMSYDMEDNLKELITQNLNKYDPETIEKSIKELKKRLTPDEIKDIATLKFIPDNVLKILVD